MAMAVEAHFRVWSSGRARFQLRRSLLFVQPQSTELPATTEGLLTVLVTCAGCVFQVT